MPNINKPFYALAYSALGVTLPPMTFKAAEIVSGFTFSPTIWKLVWLVSIVSLIILAGSLLYIIIYVVPIEKLIYKVIHPVVNLFSYKNDDDCSNDILTAEEVPAIDSSVNSDDEQHMQEAKEELLDERHTMFLPYVNDDCTELPSMPIFDNLGCARQIESELSLPSLAQALDILDEVFKTNSQKKDVGMVLYCTKSLKWITAFPPYKQMAAIFGLLLDKGMEAGTLMTSLKALKKEHGLTLVVLNHVPKRYSGAMSLSWQK